MRNQDGSGSPTFPQPEDSQPAGNDDFQREQSEHILALLVPEVRTDYGLYSWGDECRADVARAMELVSEERDFTGPLDLESWLRSQARRAVAERVVAQVKRGGPTLGRCHCLDVLHERIEHYYALYWLKLDATTRKQHRKDAERLMDERLAEYSGTPAFHHWIRQLAHRDDDAQRDNLHCLEDWLDLLARLTVERYVVQEMRRNPDSHLLRLNLIWTARKVAWYHGTHCGEPTDPRASAEEIWAVLLRPVWPPLREMVCADTNEVMRRILKGLPGFKQNSSFDTWRISIVRKTMYSLLRPRRADKLNTTPISMLTDEDGRPAEDCDPALADDGSSLDEHAIWAQVWQQSLYVFERALAEDPAMAKYIRLRLAGWTPREIAAKYPPVTAAEVSRAYFLFKQRVRRIWEEIGGDHFG